MIDRNFYEDFPTLREKDGKRIIYLDSEQQLKNLILLLKQLKNTIKKKMLILIEEHINLVLKQQRFMKGQEKR